MKNGLMVHDLYLFVCERITVCACTQTFVYVFHLTILVSPLRARLSLPVLRLRPGLNSPRENGKQSEANCRAAAERHTQVEGEVLRALSGCSLAVGEQQLADGCEAEMIHTDSAVPVSVP